MLAFAALLALHAAAAPPLGGQGSVAVVDLSPAAQPALATALRKTPKLKERAQEAATTAAVVEDAKGLGLACTVADVDCLEKLLVLLRTDSLVAYSLQRRTVQLVWLDAGSVARATVKLVAPNTTARAALDALEEAPLERKVPPGVLGPAPPDPSAPPQAREPEAPPHPPSAPGPARSLAAEAGDGGGFSPMLGLAVGGSLVAVGCGAGALGVSADLANQLIDAQQPGGAVDPARFQEGELVFGALLACSLAGMAAGAVGGVLFFAEPSIEPLDASAGEPAESLSGR